MTDSLPAPIIQAITRARALLLRRDMESATRLVQTYGQIWVRLQQQLKTVDDAIAAGRDQQYLKDRVLALARQVEDEVARYAIYADQEVANQVRTSIGQGLGDAVNAVQARLWPHGGAVIQARWHHLPADAVETMLGMTGPSSPLYARMTERLGASVADGVRQGLTEGIALGYNPVKIQNRLRQTLGQGLTWSLSATRTAQLWAYREATRAGYLANSDIVSSWVWSAALDGRCCLSCWAKHGTVHPLSEPLNDHWCGRCAAIPNTRSWAELGFEGIPETGAEIEPGETVFAGLDEQTQRQLMGESMWKAWKDDAFQFSDLSTPYQDDVYGEMWTEASLKGILGEKAKDYYKQKEAA